MPEYATENSLLSQLFIHFGLRGNPFGVTPDPRFLYPTRTHREALASLINGIECSFGFQVLIAQPGMGKTSLLFNLLERLRNVALTAFLFHPQREPHELLQSVLNELGTKSEETSLRKLSEQLNQVLCRAAQEHKRVIVIVDEAQNLEFPVLEALRQLSNFETAHTKLLQIILAGQPQLAENLKAPQQEQLLQRISAIGRLSPLALEETQAYIDYRLATAGHAGRELFTEGAVRRIWHRSKGIPRNINTLCFNAMLLAFAERAKSIDERILQETERDLDLNRVLADVYQIEPSTSDFGDNNKVTTIRKTPSEMVNAFVAMEEDPVASAGSVSRQGEVAAASTCFVDGNTARVGENIPPALVEALAPVSQAPQNSLGLTEKPASLSPPLSLLPAIPPAAPGKTSQLRPATLTESGTLPAIQHDRTPNPEKNLPLPLQTAENAVSSDRKSASDPAPRKPAKPPAEPSPMSEAPVTPKIAPAIAKPHSKHRILWPKALALVALTGILALVLIGKFGLQTMGKVEAMVSGRSATAESATVNNDAAAGYSVPIEAPTSPTDGRTPSAENTAAPVPDPKALSPKAPDPKASGRAQSEEIIVPTSPTDRSMASTKAAHTQEPQRIFFNENSDVIGSQYSPQLQQIADALARDSTASIILEGHTDGLGPEAYNLDLSSRRAIAVRNALVHQLHVPETRLTAKGAGSAAPLQPNSSAAGRAYNRRVEVRLIHSSQ